jgi:hypothetical protein
MRLFRSLQYFGMIAFLFILKPATGQKIYSCDNCYDADFKVFVVDNRYDADLLVFKVDNQYDVNNDGLWFFVDNRYDAKKKIYFCDNRYDADLLIFFVDNRYDAKWVKRSKMPLIF